MDKVTLHRCPFTFIKLNGHGCHAAQKALEEQGIEHDVATAPLRRSHRTEVERVTGQTTVPVIEFADGSAYRDDGSRMAAEIRAGRLLDHKGDVPNA